MTKPLCYHENKIVVWADINTWGDKRLVKQLRHQCADCGHLLANALPHAMAQYDTPNVDMEKLQQWNDYDIAMRKKAAEDAQRICGLRLDEFRIRHEAYMRSAEWQRMRRLIFARSHGLCEGCGENAATEVHHLSYDHFEHEFLWELVAVCRWCHARWHEK